MTEGHETKTEAIVGLIVNLVLPGLGTIIMATKNKELMSTGIIQLVISLVSIPLAFVIIGFITGFAMWIWALVVGIKELSK